MVAVYCMQYTYLLTSQLESQRLFFEEKLVIVEKEANEQVGECTHMLVPFRC